MIYFDNVIIFFKHIHFSKKRRGNFLWCVRIYVINKRSRMFKDTLTRVCFCFINIIILVAYWFYQRHMHRQIDFHQDTCQSKLVCFRLHAMKLMYIKPLNCQSSNHFDWQITIHGNESLNFLFVRVDMVSVRLNLQFLIKQKNLFAWPAILPHIFDRYRIHRFDA